jgi:hypothetical protein
MVRPMVELRTSHYSTRSSIGIYRVSDDRTFRCGCTTVRQRPDGGWFVRHDDPAPVIVTVRAMVRSITHAHLDRHALVPDGRKGRRPDGGYDGADDGPRIVHHGDPPGGLRRWETITIRSLIALTTVPARDGKGWRPDGLNDGGRTVADPCIAPISSPSFTAL